MIMNEKPRESFILQQGLFDQPGKKVSPRTPGILPDFKDYPANRLGLARWLASDENPLFARVTVNRLWQQFFGVGLVKTSDNFGLQGELPSHPQLLDWLALGFRESGWDLRSVIRRIVLSDTYGQSSDFRGDVDDPENRLLARGPSFRLPAELIRDQALAVGGLLSRKVGGPSVKPYQPNGVWGDLNAPASHAEIYQPGTGEDLYRKEPLHLLAEGGATSGDGHLRRAQPGCLHGPADGDQHPASGARRVARADVHRVRAQARRERSLAGSEPVRHAFRRVSFPANRQPGNWVCWKTC